MLNIHLFLDYQKLRQVRLESIQLGKDFSGHLFSKAWFFLDPEQTKKKFNFKIGTWKSMIIILQKTFQNTLQ